MSHEQHITFTSNGRGERDYDVYFLGVYVGRVYYDADAWSYARWFIFGERVEHLPGGYGGSNANRRPLKPYGARDRMAAAVHCAVMGSAAVTAAQP